MITFIVVMCLTVCIYAQYKIIDENKAIRRYGWSYSKEEREFYRAVRVGSLIFCVVAVVVGSVIQDVRADNLVKATAYSEGCSTIPTYVDSLHMDYRGVKSGGIEWAFMCPKCEETIGQHYNPAHGHELITTSNGELVRSCPLD